MLVYNIDPSITKYTLNSILKSAQKIIAVKRTLSFENSIKMTKDKKQNVLINYCITLLNILIA